MFHFVMLLLLCVCFWASRKVIEKLFKLPPTLVAVRLTPLLLARFVVLESRAREHLFPHLLTPAPGINRRKQC